MRSACELLIRNEQKEKQEQNTSVKWLLVGDHKKEFEEVNSINECCMIYLVLWYISTLFWMPAEYSSKSSSIYSLETCELTGAAILLWRQNPWQLSWNWGVGSCPWARIKCHVLGCSWAFVLLSLELSLNVWTRVQIEHSPRKVLRAYAYRKPVAGIPEMF